MGSVECRLVVGFLILMLAGCGDGISPSTLESSQVSYDEAIAAIDTGDFDRAHAGLTTAIESGGLGPDSLVDAYLRRAFVRKELHRLDEALADIEAASTAAPDLSALHQLRGDIYIDRGDLGTARAEYAEARKLNPKIDLPEALK